MRRLTWQRLLAIATGLLAGLGAGILVADGALVPLVAAVVVGVAAASATRVVEDPAERLWLLKLLALGFVLRFAAAVVLHSAGQALGREGITGDDAEYARVAWGYAQFLRGDPEAPYAPPYWNGSAYLFGTYVYLVTGTFLLLGPVVLVPSIVNAGLGAVALVFVFNIGSRLFGRAAGWAAAVLVAFYPSLVLWSALNLKDALALLIISMVLWSVLRFQRSPRIWWLVMAYSLLWPMETLRRYIFMGLTILIPIGVSLASRRRMGARARWSAGTLAASVLLLLANQASSAWLSPGTFALIEDVRRGMSANARTGFVELPPLNVREGDTFVVLGPVSPSASSQVVVVPAGARIVLDSLRPGDVVVIGGPATTPAPPETWRVLPGDTSVQLWPASAADENVGLRTVQHLPKGIAYALFAPFPWAIDRQLDLLTVPEMLVWYVLLLSAAVTVWKERHNWQLFAPVLLFVLGTLFIFALAEGNVGTLFRHRAMVIPFVIVFAGPALTSFWTRIREFPLTRSITRVIAAAGPR